MIVALVVLGILYKRMIGREIPSPVSRKQAIIPIIFGLISLPASFVLLLGIARGFLALGINSSGANPVLRSLIAALVMAGIPEELAKLFFILLALRIFRSHIRNVYEYILIGAAVGFGFSILEEFLYGSSSGIVAIVRLFTIAAHMIFGIIMARHLGFARHKKETGDKSVAMETIFAILIPILIHTIFDTFTGCSYLLQSERDDFQFFGMILAALVTIILFIAQIIILLRLKRNSGKYCNMMFEQGDSVIAEME